MAHLDKLSSGFVRISGRGFFEDWVLFPLHLVRSQSRLAPSAWPRVSSPLEEIGRWVVYFPHKPATYRGAYRHKIETDTLPGHEK